MFPRVQPLCLSCTTWLTCSRGTPSTPEAPQGQQSIDQSLEGPCRGSWGLCFICGPQVGAADQSSSLLHLLSSAPCKAPSEWACAQEPLSLQTSKEYKATWLCRVNCWLETGNRREESGCGEIVKGSGTLWKACGSELRLGFFVETRCPIEETGMLSPANKGPSGGWSQLELLP